MSEPTPVKNSNALRLLSIPFAFTQDELLNTRDFVEWAIKWGVDVSTDDVRELVRRRLLSPTFVLAEAADPKVALTLEWGPYLRFAHWAHEGRLRDGFEAWTATPAEDLLFSQWQVFDLNDALAARAFLRHGYEESDDGARALNRRRVAMTISALAPRHLPSITGQYVFPNMIDQDDFYRHRHETGELVRIEASGARPAELREWAEYLLISAKDDPSYSWWPVMRHANNNGWKDLRGETGRAVWKRVAAEVLLRAHEHLADDGVVEPLPDLTGTTWWTGLLDRVTPRERDVVTLDNALNALGVSPLPRVTLVVEGHTEELHIRRLLTKVGADRSSQVRLFVARGTKMNPHHLARWVSAPRIASFRGDRAVVDGPPTATFIAMDPENFFETKAKRDALVSKLKSELRADVEAQGALIADDELDQLVDLRVWNERCYEQENFTDEELAEAITLLSLEQGREVSEVWRKELREHLLWARSSRLDIGAALGRAGVREQKVRLAELLLPVLLAKLEAEVNKASTPVIRLVLDVRRRMAQLSASGYVLQRAPTGEEE